MRGRLLIAAWLAIALSPSPAFAWGFEAHRFIMQRAIELLPPELKPFFVDHRAELVVRVVDPDMWRNVGWPEDPNHFLDFGVKEYGEYPFTLLPREYGAALQKFGRATLERNGLLPWRTAEIFGRLQRTFEDFKREAPYTVSDTVYFSAILSHYVQDAHQPFHAIEDYDGIQAGQRGIHNRFERDLFERFRERLTVNPPPARPVANPRDASFDTILESHQLAGGIFAADKAALGSRSAYDDDYFNAFFAALQPMLEKRLGEAASATAGFIIGAWEQAGRPALRMKDARPIEKPR